MAEDEKGRGLGLIAFVSTFVFRIYQTEEAMTRKWTRFQAFCFFVALWSFSVCLYGVMMWTDLWWSGFGLLSGLVAVIGLGYHPHGHRRKLNG